MQYKKFIIIISGKARVGKDTFGLKIKNAVHELSGIEYKKVSLAEPVKEIASKYMGWDGKKDKKGRKLLIDIGTTIGRAYCQDVWVKYITLYYINPFVIVNEKCIVCIPDNRFPDEIENIIKFRCWDVKIISIRIKGEQRITSNDFVDKEDSTEISMDNYDNFDYTIENNGTTEDLQIKANEIIHNLFKEKDEIET